MDPQVKVAPAWIVQIVDDIISRTKGKQVVETDKDWETVSRMIDMCFKFYPLEIQDFKKQMKDWREVTAANKGYSKSKEIKNTGMFPLRLQKMIRIGFPLQSFDKRFTNKLMLKYPLFKI